MDRTEPIADNEPYHIYNRGNNRQRIFHEERDYLVFLKKLDAAAVKHACVPKRCTSACRHAVSLVAFAVMPNHYHLLAIQRTGGSVPDMMEALGMSVAKLAEGFLERGLSAEQGNLHLGSYDPAPILAVFGGSVQRYIEFVQQGIAEEGFLLPGLDSDEGNLLP
jgi:REP element-mobilizing transposase RayT